MKLIFQAIPNCLYESIPPNLPIYDNFPKQCWALDGSSFLVIAISDGTLSLISASPKNGRYNNIITKYYLVIV